MTDRNNTLIMKFGGKVLEGHRSYTAIAQKIRQAKENYPRIVVVVSAMRGVTDQLISLAHKVHPSPPKREYDMLVSTGERISMSLLAMALDLERIEAVSFTGSQSGVITDEEHGGAKIVDVRPTRLLSCLARGAVAIVAGFQGVSRDKEITTLGRGGSDTTAVALGVAMQAKRVEFYKDVEGIFGEHPTSCLPCLGEVDYEEARTVIANTGGEVLHLRAVELACVNNIPLRVSSLTSEGTFIRAEKKRDTMEPKYEDRLPTHCYEVGE